MRRLAIIDHSDHSLFIDDVSEDALAAYNGDEQAYIDDNYTFEGDYSWDWITDTEYMPENEDTPIDVEFTDWI